MEKNYGRDSSPTPPPYSVGKNTEQDYPTKESRVEQGYSYPQGYSNVPTQYNACPPQPGGICKSTQGPYPPQQQPFQQQGNYVITSQPNTFTEVTVGGTSEPKPPNYMCFSILVCLCCSCLFGIVAIAFSCKSNSAYNAGHVDTAKKYGQKAKTCAIVGIIVSVIISLTYFLLSWFGVIDINITDIFDLYVAQPENN